MAAGSAPTSLDIIYDVALKRLDEQLKAIESLDVKARAYAAFAVAFTALVVSSLGRSSSQPVHILVELGMLRLEILFGVFVVLFFAFLFCVMFFLFCGVLPESDVQYLVDVGNKLPELLRLPA